MATLGFQVLIQAVEQLIKDSPSEKMKDFQLIWLDAIMLTATGVKLILYIYCRSSGNKVVLAYAKLLLYLVMSFTGGLILLVPYFLLSTQLPIGLELSWKMQV